MSCFEAVSSNSLQASSLSAREMHHKNQTVNSVTEHHVETLWNSFFSPQVILLTLSEMIIWSRYEVMICHALKWKQQDLTMSVEPLEHCGRADRSTKCYQNVKGVCRLEFVFPQFKAAIWEQNWGFLGGFFCSVLFCFFLVDMCRLRVKSFSTAPSNCWVQYLLFSINQTNILISHGVFL